jgi:hypothetical protein
MALGGGQDLGNKQVSAGTHLGKLVPIRLGQEVDRAEFEGLKRHISPLLSQGADHDHRRLVHGQERRQGVQARDLGHFDVQRDDVRLEPRCLKHRLATIAGCANNFDRRGRAE